mgnify:CR=1 FL=1
MKVRVITAIIGIIAVLGLVYLGGWFLTGAIFLVSLLALLEYDKMLKHFGVHIYLKATAIATAVMVLASGFYSMKAFLAAIFLAFVLLLYLISQLRELVEDNVQVHIVGEPSALSDDLRREIAACEKDTAKCDGIILNVAINYGGRMEIVQAVQQIAREVKSGTLDAESITEETISSHLYPSDAQDVDLMIRTGGESRISNFLLWQISYGELYFTPVLWPDFTEEELSKAIDWFTGRDRRFGGLTEDKK